MKNMNRTDIRFFPKENAALRKNRILLGNVKADFWVDAKRDQVKYRNHWWNCKKVLNTSDTLDEKGYIRRGSDNTPLKMKTVPGEKTMGAWIHELKSFLRL